MREVVIELLWMMDVTITARRKEVRSFLKRYLSRKTSILARTSDLMILTILVREEKSRIRAPARMITGLGIRVSVKSITGVVMSFMGLRNFTPPIPMKLLARTVADFSRTWKVISSGKSTMTARILKKSWTVAAAKAL